MTPPARSLLLLGALLTWTAAAQPQPALQERRVVLTGEAAQAEVLRLAPGVVTVVLFEEDLDRNAVAWDGPKVALARFGITEREILLEPSAATGERLGQLRVHFAEGALIEAAEFAILLAPAQVDRQVRVVQQPSSPAVWKAALARERARGARKDDELAALRARCEAASLTGLIFARLLEDKDIISRLVPTMGWEVAPGMEADSARVHRAGGRVALAFRLTLAAGAQPWEPAEARLTHAGTGARIAVLSTRMDRSQLAPGQEALVVVEWEGPPGGPFTLEVPEREGSRGVKTPGLTFQ